MLVSRENTLNASRILADLDNVDNVDNEPVDEDKTPEPLPSIHSSSSSNNSDNAWAYHEDIGRDHFRPGRARLKGDVASIACDCCL
jgi:hypothetical protein